MSLSGRDTHETYSETILDNSKTGLDDEDEYFKRLSMERKRLEQENERRKQQLNALLEKELKVKSSVEKRDIFDDDDKYKEELILGSNEMTEFDITGECSEGEYRSEEEQNMYPESYQEGTMPMEYYQPHLNYQPRPFIPRPYFDYRARGYARPYMPRGVWQPFSRYQNPSLQPKLPSPPPERSSKLDYLFTDTKYFLIKSANHENVALAMAKGVWSCLPPTELRINTAFKMHSNVIVVFSVKESGKFQGYARIGVESNHNHPPIRWVLPDGVPPHMLGGVFTLDWINRQDLPFEKITHIRNQLNEGLSVKIGRDGQELCAESGEALCRRFPKDNKIDLRAIAQKSKRSLKQHGLKVIKREKPKNETNLVVNQTSGYSRPYYAGYRPRWRYPRYFRPYQRGNYVSRPFFAQPPYGMDYSFDPNYLNMNPYIEENIDTNIVLDTSQTNSGNVKEKRISSSNTDSGSSRSKSIKPKKRGKYSSSSSHSGASHSYASHSSRSSYSGSRSVSSRSKSNDNHSRSNSNGKSRSKTSKSRSKSRASHINQIEDKEELPNYIKTVSDTKLNDDGKDMIELQNIKINKLRSKSLDLNETKHNLQKKNLLPFNEMIQLLKTNCDSPIKPVRCQSVSFLYETNDNKIDNKFNNNTSKTNIYKHKIAGQKLIDKSNKMLFTTKTTNTNLNVAKISLLNKKKSNNVKNNKKIKSKNVIIKKNKNIDLGSHMVSSLSENIVADNMNDQITVKKLEKHLGSHLKKLNIEHKNINANHNSEIASPDYFQECEIKKTTINPTRKSRVKHTNETLTPENQYPNTLKSIRHKEDILTEVFRKRPMSRSISPYDIPSGKIIAGKWHSSESEGVGFESKRRPEKVLNHKYRQHSRRDFNVTQIYEPKNSHEFDRRQTKENYGRDRHLIFRDSHKEPVRFSRTSMEHDTIYDDNDRLAANIYRDKPRLKDHFRTNKRVFSPEHVKNTQHYKSTFSRVRDYRTSSNRRIKTPSYNREHDKIRKEVRHGNYYKHEQTFSDRNKHSVNNSKLRHPEERILQKRRHESDKNKVMQEKCRVQDNIKRHEKEKPALHIPRRPKTPSEDEFPSTKNEHNDKLKPPGDRLKDKRNIRKPHTPSEDDTYNDCNETHPPRRKILLTSSNRNVEQTSEHSSRASINEIRSRTVIDRPRYPIKPERTRNINDSEDEPSDRSKSKKSIDIHKLRGMYSDRIEELKRSTKSPSPKIKALISRSKTAMLNRRISTNNDDLRKHIGKNRK